MPLPGSTVRFAKMPEWVATLPDESRRVFELCFGRTYRIREIEKKADLQLKRENGKHAV